MDLLSTVRKSGSRGGVNFDWNDVSSSVHRENYLGHSLKAPVGRWQQGKDLGWYAKGDSDNNANPNETEEERKVRERKGEIRKIKEAEEDAMAKALGLPPPVRNTSGANAIDVGPSRTADEKTIAKVEPRDKQTRDDRGRKAEPDRRRRARSRSRSRSRPRRHARDYKDERRGGRRERSRSRERNARDEAHGRWNKDDAPRDRRRHRSLSPERVGGRVKGGRSRSPRQRRDRSREAGRRHSPGRRRTYGDD